MFFVYFLESEKNNKIYIGSTDKEPRVRIKEHNEGASKFTRQNRPWKLIYFEKYHCKTDARSRELFYKSGFGRKIKSVIIQSLIEGSVSAKGGSARKSASG
jgi:putative endonuclease